MKIWFPDYYTEAHRSPDRQQDLVNEMRTVGIEPVKEPDKECILCFCGSIFMASYVRETNPGLPVVHYNWDLYPYMVTRDTTLDWSGYLKDLKTCRMILVPNEGTTSRTYEFTGRDSEIVKAPVKIWDLPEYPGPDVSRNPQSYFLDVMRDYSWDRNNKLSDTVCHKFKYDLVRTKTMRLWDEFRYLVANAKALLSCVVEASTGGLTLLEGYAHGVPVIAYGGPLNGAREYFGNRVSYFTDDIRSLIQLLNDPPPRSDPVEARKWVEETHSDKVFAARLKECFQSCKP